MIIVLFISVFLIYVSPCFGQVDYSEIDINSRVVPDSLTGYKSIAEYLSNGLKTDDQKARAIYIWIAHNIQYDMVKIDSEESYFTEQNIINEVLKNRKGLCQHYSELFLAMCSSLGLKCYLIDGYTRTIYGGIADYSHAWNGIKIDSNYYLIDVTWAAGYELNGRYLHDFRDDYFLIPPDIFIEDHMPFDPIWQFLDNPLTNKDFISKDFSRLNNSGSFAFEDSIRLYEKQPEPVQLENSTRRIIANGAGNMLIQKKLDENFLQITAYKYNSAVDTLRTGIDLYNQYIHHKNRYFRNPKLQDARIKELIDNAGYGIYAANEILDAIFTPDTELSKLITETRNRMPDIISHLEREKHFIERYLRKWRPLRIFSFLVMD